MPKMKQWAAAVLTTICLTLVVFGCSEQGDMMPSSRTSSDTTETDSRTSTSDTYVDGDVDGESSVEAVDETVSSTMEIEAGQLTAAEWSDLENWEFWESLMSPAGEKGVWQIYWGISTLYRVPVVVQNGLANVVDAQVRLLRNGDVVWETRTDNRGVAELFVPTFEQTQDAFSVEVVSGNETATVAVSAVGTDVPIRVELAGATPKRVLDLMFVIDTTGSMADELSYLTAELENVVNEVAVAQQQSIVIRTSVNMYRDEGDEYVVRAFPFTTDSSAAAATLRAQSAAGGGDTPEAVDQALENAVLDHTWSEQAVSRLCFLILDAPPHYNEEVLQSLYDSISVAASLGIRIIPVASSGVDEATEFLLRMMAINTGGTYTFLTDDSGIGNAHLTPTTGSYEVEYLNDLLIRLITEHIE